MDWQRIVRTEGVEVQARRARSSGGSDRSNSGFRYPRMTAPLALPCALFFTLDDASNDRPDPVVSNILRAAKRGDAASLERLLSAAGKGVDVNARHPLGWGALHVAAINGRREAVGALLRAGADPNLPEEYVNIYNTAREKGMHSLGALF